MADVSQTTVPIPNPTTKKKLTIDDILASLKIQPDNPSGVSLPGLFPMPVNAGADNQDGSGNNLAMPQIPMPQVPMPYSSQAVPAVPTMQGAGVSVMADTQGAQGMVSVPQSFQSPLLSPPQVPTQSPNQLSALVPPTRPNLQTMPTRNYASDNQHKPQEALLAASIAKLLGGKNIAGITANYLQGASRGSDIAYNQHLQEMGRTNQQAMQNYGIDRQLYGDNVRAVALKDKAASDDAKQAYERYFKSVAAGQKDKALTQKDNELTRRENELKLKSDNQNFMHEQRASQLALKDLESKAKITGMEADNALKDPKYKMMVDEFKNNYNLMVSPLLSPDARAYAAKRNAQIREAIGYGDGQTMAPGSFLPMSPFQAGALQNGASNAGVGLINANTGAYRADIANKQVENQADYQKGLLALGKDNLDVKQKQLMLDAQKTAAQIQKMQQEIKTTGTVKDSQGLLNARNSLYNIYLRAQDMAGDNQGKNPEQGAKKKAFIDAIQNNLAALNAQIEKQGIIAPISKVPPRYDNNATDPHYLTLPRVVTIPASAMKPTPAALKAAAPGIPKPQAKKPATSKPAAKVDYSKMSEAELLKIMAGK